MIFFFKKFLRQTDKVVGKRGAWREAVIHSPPRYITKRRLQKVLPYVSIIGESLPA